MMVDRHLKVKHWEELQHYKDRVPPWIKLYNTVLDNYEFTQLTDSERFHLVGIWLLASRTNNRVPNDARWIQQRLFASEPVNVPKLVQLGFIYVHPPEQVASTALACGYGDRDIEERRGEQISRLSRGEEGTRERLDTLEGGWPHV